MNYGSPSNIALYKFKNKLSYLNVDKLNYMYKFRF
jgi:hypothetical protein